MKFWYLIVVFLFSFGLKAGEDLLQFKKELSEINMLIYSNPNKAINEGLKWAEKAEKHPDFQVSFLLAVANAYAVLKEHELSFKYAFEAKSIAEKSKNSVNQIKVLGFLSSQFQRLELEDKALEYLEQADSLTRIHNLPDSLMYLKGNILFFRGVILKKKLGNEYALQNFLKSINIFEKDTINKTNIASLSILYSKVGDIYIENEKADLAKSYYEKGLEYAKDVNSNKLEGASMYGLGKVLLNQNKVSDAVSIIIKALNKSTDAKDTAIVIEMYKSLSFAFGKLGNESEKQKYHQLYLDAEKKLLAKEEHTLNKLVQKLEKENQKKEKKSNKKLFLYVFFLTFLLLAILFYIYKLIQKRRHLKSMSIK